MMNWSARTFLIAEAGVNHNGDIKLAKALIDAAADAGCDAVKFQTFSAEQLVTATAKMADYQKKNTGTTESQLQMLKRLELGEREHYELMSHAKEKNIIFFSTAFDMKSVEFLAQLNIPVWKIPSGEITNYPYLVRIASFGKPIILSTGMATLAEVDDAVRVLLDNGATREQLCILHCNTDYPTQWSDVNLLAMSRMGASFGTAYGYSDHTQGIEIPIAATALGASVIEKHFTIDRSLPGPDHKASLEPAELSAMVKAVRNIEIALGNGIKSPTESEKRNRIAARKSIVAARRINAGEHYSEENMTVKRPGDGITPMAWSRLIGHVAPRNFEVDEPLTW